MTDDSMIIGRKGREGIFQWLIPLLALTISAGIILVPALEAYTALRRADKGPGMIVLGAVSFPTDHLPSISIQMAALRGEKFLMLVNAPGHFLFLILSLALGHSAHWSPTVIGPALWRDVCFPIGALPAWFLVGRAINSWTVHALLRRTELIVASVLAIVFALISGGLWFGLTPEERTSQEFLESYVVGFALWSALMCLTVVAWIRLKHRSQRIES